MTRSYLGRRYESMKIVWKMHHYRFHHFVGRIEDMDALNRTVATVHVIKLHLLGITLDGTQHLIVRTSEIYYAAHYPSPHREDERLFIRIGIEADLLGESTHLLGIVYRLDDETFAGSNARLRIIYLRTAAAFQHIVDNQRLVPVILQHEFSSYRLAEHHLSAVYHLVLGCNLLC